MGNRPAVAAKLPIDVATDYPRGLMCAVVEGKKASEQTLLDFRKKLATSGLPALKKDTKVEQLDKHTYSTRIDFESGAALLKWAESQASARNSQNPVSPDVPFADPAKLTHAQLIQLVSDAAHACVAPGVNIELFPCHTKDGPQAFRNSYRLPMVGPPPLPTRNYFGNEVAYYFAWISHYNTCLLLPGILGVLCYAYGAANSLTAENNPTLPAYSIFVTVWAVWYVKDWERQEHFLAVEFNEHYEPLATKTKYRRGYYGNVRKSPVTGDTEIHYSGWIRNFIHQPVSWAITMLCLAFAILVQVCSLNLQGYMSGNRHNALKIDFLDQYAEEGRIFDPNGNYFVVPVIIHGAAIFCLNMAYRSIAQVLTEWENYATEEEHQNAMITKRVFFEFIDCFAALFYVAFYRLDVLLLRQELISLFSFDQVRRFLLETAIPGLQRFIGGKEKRGKDETLDEWEPFDDYVEMVMQFGYITLFASSFPLAAGISFVLNFVEIRSDTVKLSLLIRRPTPSRATSIGPWLGVLKLFAIMSVSTNSLLFGFSSDQLVYWRPEWYEGPPHFAVRPGYEGNVVACVFLAEHVLLLLVAFLFWRIPSFPKKAEDTLLHRKYVRAVQAGLIKRDHHE